MTEVDTMVKPSLAQEVLGISLQLFIAIICKMVNASLYWIGDICQNQRDSFVEAPSDLRVHQAL